MPVSAVVSFGMINHLAWSINQSINQ